MFRVLGQIFSSLSIYLEILSSKVSYTVFLFLLIIIIFYIKKKKITKKKKMLNPKSVYTYS